MKNKIIKLIGILLFFGILTLTVFVNTVRAVYVPEAQVSITFDDGFKSTYRNAVPVMSSRNIPATIYISSGLIGGNYDGQPMMNWSEVQNLQNTYRWEIGGHTVSHIELPNFSTTRLIKELTNSNTTLSGKGLAVSNFATPYGAYNNTVLREALKRYGSHRGFADRGFNDFPYNRAVLRVQSVEEGVTPATVRNWINQAKANNQWLILVFHMVGPVSGDYEYTVPVSEFTTMMNDIKNSGLKIVTIKDGLKKPGMNVFTNSDFSGGLNGWTRDNTGRVLLDTNSNGAYPEARNSVKITGGASSLHLFSMETAVVSGTSYIFESYINAMNISAGEVGFYVDEYDASGNWVSGKWLGSVAPRAIGYFYNWYTPTSSSVYKVVVQAYVDAGTSGSVYLDNIVLQNLEGTLPPAITPTPSPTATPSVLPTATPTALPTATLTPSPSPTATPTVVPTGTPLPTATPTVSPTPTVNLVQNGSFESTDDSGWAVPWIRQTVNWVVDSLFATEGSKSIKITGTGRTHLFSDMISVNSVKTYTWKQHVKAERVGSEFGFYIDEYDAGGNWISGQWKGELLTGFQGIKEFTYIPTSANVAKIGLQYYHVGGGTDTLINIDSVSLTSN